MGTIQARDLSPNETGPLRLDKGISRVNLQFNPQQIATKGFSRIWVVFDIISNILKVP